MLTVDLKKRFEKKGETAFRLDVSFAVENGFTVLTGASGAGKTTVLRLIAGISTPDEGLVKIDSNVFFDSANKIDLPIQTRRVGFVFQDYALFPHFTAEENIAYGVKAGNQKTKIERAREMLALFRVEHIKNRIPREMSGGEQQRVALARALASEPLMVLLDEPLSAVDVETRLKLLDEIENAQARAAIPFIYVTHNEAEAERFGKQRIHIQNGKTID
ncbi:MAG TPA: ATP-binding cassette domain-containing protein [Pyrinomonadaceae bacterium]|jgi:molybdate transport system ATP-binding protein